MGGLRFLLDENVLYQAHSGQDERGESDYSAGRLVLAIADQCHKIVLDDELRRRYREILKRLETVKGQLAVNISKVLSILMSTSAKVFEPTARAVRLPADLSEDRPLVELAIDASAIYVTSDHRLKARLDRLSIPQRYGLTVVTADYAAATATRTN